MANEYENLGTGSPVQTPSTEQSAGATEKLTPELIAGKKPEEVADLYNNILEKNRAADRKYQEAAEKERQLAAEREYWAQERQTLLDREKQAYDQLNQFAARSQERREPINVAPPKYEEMTPDQAYQQLVNNFNDIKRQNDELRNDTAKKLEAVEGQFAQYVQKQEYNRAFKELIAPKYPNVKQRDLDEWLTNHPNVTQPDERVMVLAADELQKAYDAEIERRVQEKILAKEKLANEAQGIGSGGAGLGSIKPIKNFIDLDESEQVKQLSEDHRKIVGQ